MAAVTKEIDDHKENTPTSLGSWVCTNVSLDRTYNKYQIREYFGLSKDIEKLPKYTDLGTGSYAYCIDTQDLYIFSREQYDWIKQ